VISQLKLDGSTSQMCNCHRHVRLLLAHRLIPRVLSQTHNLLESHMPGRATFLDPMYKRMAGKQIVTYGHQRSYSASTGIHLVCLLDLSTLPVTESWHCLSFLPLEWTRIPACFVVNRSRKLSKCPASTLPSDTRPRCNQMELLVYLYVLVF